jgi:predicted site-specific integrase-resolvase
MQTLENSSPATASVARRAFTLKEAAAMVGRSYHTLYRSALRGDIRVMSGLGTMMISDQELERFLERSEQYRPVKRKKITAEADQE